MSRPLTVDRLSKRVRSASGWCGVLFSLKASSLVAVDAGLVPAAPIALDGPLTMAIACALLAWFGFFRAHREPGLWAAVLAATLLLDTLVASLMVGLPVENPLLQLSLLLGLYVAPLFFSLAAYSASQVLRREGAFVLVRQQPRRRRRAEPRHAQRAA